MSELSKGKLGYIHIPSMDKEGLDRFVRALYSDSFDKEAIVLDVRNNGGGATHDKVLNYLGGREHTLFRQRYGVTPFAFQRNLRVERARDALKHGESLADAAAETGFADQSHLGRAVRAVMGATPGHYRQSFVPT